MKNIRLMQLSIENFKKIRRLDIDFGGDDWTIYGRNAVGKTSIYDAFYWLLFNKDSHGSADFDIEPRGGDGAVINPEAVTEVSAVLDCDGTALTFTKKYYQKWQTQRGASERVYVGNTAEYFIEGVPQKKSEYDASVAAVVSEDIFKLLTNLGAFTSMHWTEQRSVLFGMCDIGDDAALMRTDERFIPLADDMGTRTFTDYRKYLDSRRKMAVAAKNAIPPRIDENIRTINEYSGIDEDATNEQLAELRRQADDIKTEKSAAGDGVAIGQCRNELAALENERRAVLIENNEYRRKQQNTDGEAEKKRLGLERDALAAEARRVTSERIFAQITLDGCKKRLAQLREIYAAEQAKEFDGSEVCPTCGRAYDDATIKDAMDAFDAAKAEILGETAAEGMKAGTEVDEAQKAYDKCDAEYKSVVEKYRAAAAAYDDYKVETREINDMPDYADKTADIDQREQEVKRRLDELTDNSAAIRIDCDRRLAEIDMKVKGLQTVLSRIALANAAAERVDELRAEERQMADEINRIDKMISLSADYTRFKVSHVQETINSRFRRPRFKLFNTQKNSGIEECCEATHNGIGFNKSLNDGARVNVALDIITALSAHHGISVPLFIDNAERVTGLLETNTQTIKLTVSADDEEMRMERNGINSEKEGEVNSTAACC